MLGRFDSVGRSLANEIERTDGKQALIIESPYTSNG
jgi:hypothetical protein